MPDCWSCHAELSANWDACPRCAALSLANAERVARGVASMAVGQVKVLHERRNGEPHWTAYIPSRWGSGARGLWGEATTRHGAALAAFDAAWRAGAERLQEVEPTSLFEVPLIHDDGITHDRIAGAWAEAFPWAARFITTHRHGKTAALRKHAAEWEAKTGGTVITGVDHGDGVDETVWATVRLEGGVAYVESVGGEDDMPQEVRDAETIAAWAEETGYRWVEHRQAVDLQWGTSRYVAVQREPDREMWSIVDPRRGMPARYLSIEGALVHWRHIVSHEHNAPPHVADAMVRQARRALGVEADHD